MYVAIGMASLPVILAGLVIEIFFVKYFTKVEWTKATSVAFLMNLVSCVIGLFTNTFSGLFWDKVLHYIFFDRRITSNWKIYENHWELHYITIVLINTLIEGGVVRLTLKLKLKNTFWWLFFANAISVIICAIYVHFMPKHL